jgi:hypothetical protein
VIALPTSFSRLFLKVFNSALKNSKEKIKQSKEVLEGLMSNSPEFA